MIVMKEQKGGITRRQLLGVAATLGLATAAYGAYRRLDQIDSLLSPEEEINVLKTETDIYMHNQDGPLKFRKPATYIEFRGTIFELYPVEAKKDENGKNSSPSALVYEAHALHSPDIRIRGDLADRALDLFNILSQNQPRLKGLPQNKIKNFKFKNAPSPIVKSGENYEVPVYTAYASLKDIPIR